MDKGRARGWVHYLLLFAVCSYPYLTELFFCPSVSYLSFRSCTGDAITCISGRTSTAASAHSLRAPVASSATTNRCSGRRELNERRGAHADARAARPRRASHRASRARGTTFALLSLQLTSNSSSCSAFFCSFLKWRGLFN